MAYCRVCGKESRVISETLSLCRECILEQDLLTLRNIHNVLREERKLNSGQGGTKEICNVCLNKCKPKDGEKSFCGLKKVEKGEINSLVSKKQAILHAYKDMLPTNCCSTWFCPQGTDPRPRTYNFAVFFYYCSFHCLFCQNHSHWYPHSRHITSIDDMVNWIKKDESIACVCYFGGTPEPHFPFMLELSRRVIQEIPRQIEICIEWNGSGRRDLVLEAARQAIESGGNVKFDLKAWSEPLHVALTGQTNQVALENFSAVTELESNRTNAYLTATTLLVPGYVVKEEIEKIADFIASHDRSIPYSLLVFHPDYLMRDLPYTPKEQALECYRAAKERLDRVHLGNAALLGLF